MKKICAVLLALLLLASLTVPALAAEEDFVPSISYKDGPDIEESEMDEEDVTDCLVVTSILQAKNKETDITQQERDLLLEVYEKLLDNTMVLPLEEDLVVRELVDVSFKRTDCVEAQHSHKQWLAREDTTISIKFDLGIPPDIDVVVLVYINEEWVPVESVTNNQDNTITCVFEDICPVAFCVPRDAQEPPAQTGDTAGQLLWLWILLLLLSLAALVMLVLGRRKFLR